MHDFLCGKEKNSSMDFNFMSTEPQGGYRSNSRQIVTLGTFFESDSNVGYVKLETLKDLLRHLETAHSFRNQYSRFFDCANEGHNVRGPVVKRTQRENQKDYIFLNMRRGRTQSEMTIYLFDNLEKFIRDYADGRISIDFNWNDLVEFCNNH